MRTKKSLGFVHACKFKIRNIIQIMINDYAVFICNLDRNNIISKGVSFLFSEFFILFSEYCTGP